MECKHPQGNEQCASYAIRRSEGSCIEAVRTLLLRVVRPCALPSVAQVAVLLAMVVQSVRSADHASFHRAAGRAIRTQSASPAVCISHHQQEPSQQSTANVKQAMGQTSTARIPADACPVPWAPSIQGPVAIVVRQ